jgi:serine/threonine protein kinase
MADRTYPDALPTDYRLHWYVLLRVLGQGGFGITYLARDTNLDQMVAIKEFLPVDMATRLPDATVCCRTEELRERYRWGLERFIQEARTLARFDHSNIVRVHSVFEANGTAYMVMRFEEGQNLASQLDRRSTLQEHELQRILLSVLDGLELVHRAGFIHRDIKPDNIHIRSDGTPVLLDFGSARHAIGKARTMTILVAPGYAPLEQYYSDSESQGPWTDIYGLAATCYRAIAGVAPLDAIARSRGILGSADDVLVPASVIGRGRYSERLLAAIDHGLAFAEKDRPQSIAEWRREIVVEAALESAAPAVEQPKAKTEHPTPVVRPVVADTPHAEPATRPSRSFPLAPFAWSVVGAAAAAIAIAVLLRVQSPDPDAESRIDKERVQLEAERIRLAEERKRNEDERKRIAEARQREEDKRKEEAAERLRIAEQQKRDEAMRKAVAEAPKRAADLRRPSEKKPAVAAATRQPKQTRPAPRPVTRDSLPSEPVVQSPVPQFSAVESDVPETTAEPIALAPKIVETRPPPTPAERLAEADRLAARGDHARTVEIVRGLAEQGNARAQTKLANIYAAGRGLARDDAAAASWYRKAADQGDSEAQLKLGHFYAEGRGVPQSANQAYIWYSLAARAGTAAAEGPRKKDLAQLQPAEIAQADRVIDIAHARRAR